MSGEGSGTPLQYSCLENPMDGGAWWAVVHGVAKSQTRLSDFTLTFHFHALEKEIATHSSVLAWRIPGMGEPGGLPSIGLHRLGHDWSDLAAAAAVVSGATNKWIQLSTWVPTPVCSETVTQLLCASVSLQEACMWWLLWICFFLVGEWWCRFRVWTASFSVNLFLTCGTGWWVEICGPRKRWRDWSCDRHRHACGWHAHGHTQPSPPYCKKRWRDQKTNRDGGNLWLDGIWRKRPSYSNKYLSCLL